MAYCTQCGAVANAQAQYCGACGARVRDASGAGAHSQGQRAEGASAAEVAGPHASRIRLIGPAILIGLAVAAQASVAMAYLAMGSQVFHQDFALQYVALVLFWLGLAACVTAIVLAVMGLRVPATIVTSIGLVANGLSTVAFAGLVATTGGTPLDAIRCSLAGLCGEFWPSNLFADLVAPTLLLAALVWLVVARMARGRRSNNA